MRALVAAVLMVFAVGMLAGCPGPNPAPKNAAAAKCPSYQTNSNDRCTVN